MNKDLENDSVSSLLVKLSIPAIVSMLIAAIYNIVDRIFVGQSDPLGLTAIGITMPFQVMQMAFVLLIGIGGSTLVVISCTDSYNTDSSHSSLLDIFRPII